LCAARRYARGMPGEEIGSFGVPIRRRSRSGLVVRNFEHLAFDDAAHAIEVRAALAFEFALILGLLLQPKDHAYGRQDDESRQWQKVVPIGEQAFQGDSMLAQCGRRASEEIRSEARRSMGCSRRAGPRLKADTLCVLSLRSSKTDASARKCRAEGRGATFKT